MTTTTTIETYNDLSDAPLEALRRPAPWHRSQLEVWYATPESFEAARAGRPLELRIQSLGDREPATHRRLGAVVDVDPYGARFDAIVASLQGERWSPRGEARELIESLGLSHTSMSAGDLIVRVAVDHLAGVVIRRPIVAYALGRGRLHRIDVSTPYRFDPHDEIALR